MPERLYLSINHELTEEYYCFIHLHWNFIDDEMDCCSSEEMHENEEVFEC